MKTSSLWSIDLGEIRKIPVRVHFSFPLLAAWFSAGSVLSGGSLVPDILFFTAVMISVLLHETAHALVAAKEGVAASSIIIYPFGGITRYIKTSVESSFKIAAGGILANFLIVMLLLPFLPENGLFWGEFGRNGGMGLCELIVRPEATLLERVTSFNLCLALLNLLPALPFDGGRMLRSGLEIFRVKDAVLHGSRIAVMLGVSCLLCGVYLVNLPILVIAGLILSQELEQQVKDKTRIAMAGLTASQVMIPASQLITFTHGVSIDRAASIALKSFQDVFPVRHSGRVIGLISRDTLLNALTRGYGGDYISSYIERDFTELTPDGILSQTGEISSDFPDVAVVMDQDTFAGLIVKDRLVELLLARFLSEQSRMSQEDEEPFY